jgi:aspartate kinase
MNKTKVLKFGGSSVADATAIARLVNVVRAEFERSDLPPVVVVSAMSGVTDRLFGLAAAAARGDRTDVSPQLDELRQRHEVAASALLSAETVAATIDAIAADLDDLRAVLTAVAILREASPRSLDGIAAAGELMSSRIVSAALTQAGIASIWIDPRQVVITNAAHTCATPAPDAIKQAADERIASRLAAGITPVIGGYVGATPDGVTTTLGRGGSDYSAALIGAALGCLEIQIWTDVDGMLTADPRIVAAPRVVPRLSFGEASELAYFGAKVLHPSTILPAVEQDIPVRILNSRHPDRPGTLITAGSASVPGMMTALACKRRITVIEVTSTRMLMAHGFLRKLFEAFERHQTSVDVVTTSEVSVSVTVDDTRHLDSIVRALRDFAEVSVESDMALLCAVGDGLRADPTLAVRVLASLEGFPLRMVSQAASRRNLTVVLHERDLTSAMSRLHDLWFAAPANGPRGTVSVSA